MRVGNIPLSSPIWQAPESVPVPKHYPFPATPVDDYLFFEIMLFTFTIMCGSLQYLHLYRTVWWLPHSYTKQTVNFYLIDNHVVIFIIIFLSRRLIYILGCRILEKCTKPKYTHVAIVSYKFFLLFTIYSSLTGSIYYVVQSHPFVNILYLCYPIVVYPILFGCNITPFFELSTWTSTAPPLHACRTTAPEIREEVQLLTLNFNHRIKQSLFNSITNAYYAGFIPCCFAQAHLYYDIYWCVQHSIFIFLTSFLLSLYHCLPARHCDILHRAARHLGAWTSIPASISPSIPWQEDAIYPQGAVVRYKGVIYRGRNECNAAVPGHGKHCRFFWLFGVEGARPLTALALLQLFYVLWQVGVLWWGRGGKWYEVFSLSLVMFFNYWLLFKVFRDWLVCWRVGEEETETKTR